jgi:hypothetical protein
MYALAHDNIYSASSYRVTAIKFPFHLPLLSPSKLRLEIGRTKLMGEFEVL